MAEVSTVAMRERTAEASKRSRLNQAMRGEWEGESDRGNQERAENQESTWLKWLDYIETRSWGKGSPWTGGV